MKIKKKVFAASLEAAQARAMAANIAKAKEEANIRSCLGIW